MKKLIETIEKSKKEGGEKNMKKILVITLATLGLLLMGTGQSFAGLSFLDNFTLKVVDINGIDQYVDDIDFINYTGISHVNITDEDSSGGVSVGDTFTDSFVFKTSGGDFENADTGTIDTYRGGTGIGVGDFELTGVFSATGTHTVVAAGNATYTFNTVTLDLYLDAPIGTKAIPGIDGGTVDGYKIEGGSATKIASFVLASGGGNFNFSNMDGNINTLLLASSVTSGYLFDENGVDFANIQYLHAVTDSNSDGNDPFGMPANWLAYTGQTVGSEWFDLNLSVDGSAQFAVVPEPASMLLLGSGLLGLAGLGRKKRKV